jgi:SAM-dependent methyltransferase
MAAGAPGVLDSETRADEPGRDVSVTEVHDVAARGFQAEATAYDRARPSYPADAVAWLIDELGISPGRRVVDLAAGTGKLTRLVEPAGADLVAVEPVGGMRERLHANLPATPLLAAVAEALPFATGSIDAMVVAQAFHWFDADRALAELARVVRVGGRLGLIWNARERGVDWADQMWSVMDAVETSAPWRDHGAGAGAGTGTAAGPADDSQRRSERYLTGGHGSAWSDWTRATFHHVHHTSHDMLIDRFRSVSHVAALPPERQAEVLDEIRTILREHPETAGSATVGISYRVDAMYAERVS